MEPVNNELKEGKSDADNIDMDQVMQLINAWNFLDEIVFRSSGG